VRTLNEFAGEIIEERRAESVGTGMGTEIRGQRKIVGEERESKWEESDA
jgi:hypothetical protein